MYLDTGVETAAAFLHIGRHRLYILRSGSEDRFKIGRTRDDVDSRTRQLATGNPRRLMIFDVIETEYDSLYETYLKRTLRSRRCLDAHAQEWFALTPEDMRSAISDAREFLADFVATQEGAARLAEEEPDGGLLTPSDAEWSIYSNLLAAREDEDTSSYLRQLLENRLKLAIGKADGLDGIATWRVQAVERLDQAALKTAEPDIFRRYAKTTRLRVLRLT